MSRYDWFLFLHLLGAFALVSTMAAFWIVAFAGRPPQPLVPAAAMATLTRPLSIIVAAGSVTALIFGVALAIDVEGYELWDGWILASIVLWGIGVGAGERSGRWLARASETGERVDWQRGVLLHATASAAVLILLALMIGKPGA